MIELSELLQQGTTKAWIFAPSAILLGALHGLEPGHSKTLMAAFIIAVKGTVRKAVLLGFSATVSHTAVVWLVALAALYFGKKINIESSTAYFQIVSSILIISVAIWMIFRTWYSLKPIHIPNHDHGDHGHSDHEHSHDHGLITDREDAHALKHAEAIRRNFMNRDVTNGQVIIFGLTGGLIPCPAAITILLLCLQVKHAVLGIGLVVCFSIGLALTLVSSGIIAALSIHHLNKRISKRHAFRFSALAHRAPYFSSLLIVTIGLYIGSQGAMSLGWL